MNTHEKSRLKNAPLAMPANRDSFVLWAMEQPDGCMSAGRMPSHPRLRDEAPSAASLPSADAALVSPKTHNSRNGRLAE
jgi:hypothetical protein